MSPPLLLYTRQTLPVLYHYCCCLQDKHYLSSLESKVAGHRVTLLDPGQLRLFQFTVSTSRKSTLLSAAVQDKCSHTLPARRRKGHSHFHRHCCAFSSPHPRLLPPLHPLPKIIPAHHHHRRLCKRYYLIWPTVQSFPLGSSPLPPLSPPKDTIWPTVVFSSDLIPPPPPSQPLTTKGYYLANSSVFSSDLITLPPPNPSPPPKDTTWPTVQSFPLISSPPPSPLPTPHHQRILPGQQFCLFL